MDTLKRSPILAGLLLAVALALIVWQGYHTFGKEPLYTGPKVPPSATTLWIREMAKKTGGDMAKLSPEERQKLDGITHGYSEVALKSELKNVGH